MLRAVEAQQGSFSLFTGDVIEGTLKCYPFSMELD